MTSRHRASEEKSSARSTRRANQRHPAIIAKIERPAPETGGGLLLCRDASERLLQFVETVASTCQQFVYELETIGTPGRQRLFAPGRPATLDVGYGHLIRPRNNFENIEIALDTSGKSGA
jgi:hypothetical protein